MKKQLVRSLAFLFCLSSTLLSCGTNNTPSTNNSSVEPSINSTEKESETISSSEEVSSESSSEEPALDESELDVYFIAGQSNAAGCSYLYRYDKTTLNLSYENQMNVVDYEMGYDNILYFGTARNQEKYSGTAQTTITPVKVGFGVEKGTQIGAELGMAEYLAKQYSGTSKKALIIKYGAVSSGLVTDTGCKVGEWSAPSYPNKNLGDQDNLFEIMLGSTSTNYSDGIVYEALKQAKEAGYNNINYKGIYWSQGEGDRKNNTEYGDALNALIGDFRTRINSISTVLASKYDDFTFNDASNLPFLISELCCTGYSASRNEDNSSTDEGINAIVKHQREVAENNINTETLTTYMYDIKTNWSAFSSSTNDGVSYCADQWHYNSDDMLDIGRRVGDILHNYVSEEGQCKHEYDLISHDDKYHIVTCSLCEKSKKTEMAPVTESNAQYHWKKCNICNAEFNKEEHNSNTLNVVQTKEYKYGDELDKNAFTVSISCECGNGKLPAVDFEVTFNETKATFNTTATVKANGLETTVNIKVNEMELGDYVTSSNARISKGETYRNFSSVVTTDTKPSYVGDTNLTSINVTNTFTTPKGGVSDGEYIYHIINGGSSTLQYEPVGIIVKIDGKTGEVVDSTSHIYMWGNNARLNLVGDKLLVTDTRGDNSNASSQYLGTYSKNFKELKGVNLLFDKELNLIDDNYKLDLGITLGTNEVIKNFVSNASNDKFVAVRKDNVKLDAYMSIYTKDANGKYKSTYVGTKDINKSTANSSATIQQIHCNDKYIYVLYTHTSTSSSHINNGAIKVYDWSGKELKDILIENSSTIYTNYQGILYCNGQWYYSNSGWTTNTGLGIFKINLDYSRI